MTTVDDLVRAFETLIEAVGVALDELEGRASDLAWAGDLSLRETADTLRQGLNDAREALK